MVDGHTVTTVNHYHTHTHTHGHIERILEHEKKIIRSIWYMDQIHIANHQMHTRNR